jgi:hypothetical protein
MEWMIGEKFTFVDILLDIERIVLALWYIFRSCNIARQNGRIQIYTLSINSGADWRGR